MSTALMLKLLGLAKQYWKQLLIVLIVLLVPILMLPTMLITIITPSADYSKVEEYREIAESANIDWGELLIYDVVINDNNLSKINPIDSAYEFLIIVYEKYKREKECVEKDENGNCIDWDYKWVLQESKTYAGKTGITKLLNKLDINSSWSLDKIINKLNELDATEKYDITISRKDLEDMITTLDYDKQEWAKALLADNAIYEMYGEYFNLPDYIPTVSAGFFAWPTPDLKKITSPFGWRIHPTTNEKSFHTGVDIAGNNANGKPIISVADGEVFQVNYSGGAAGRNIRIRHYDDEGNEWQTRYCHMSTMKVKVGDKVKQGDVIGAVGNTGRSTGPHLHIEIKFEGQLVNPLDYIR